MLNQSFQGVTDAQSDIISHWRSLAAQSRLPCPQRRQVNPGALRTHLAHLSILEVGSDGRARFRIAGSRLCEILEMDPRGRCVCDLPAGLADMWMLGLEAAIARAEPVGGIIADRSGGRPHAWLRLPLVDGDGRMRLILCHDQLIEEVDGTRCDAVPQPVHARANRIAA